MPRELLQARFDQDTVEDVQELADEKGISRSEALRRSVREGVLHLQDAADDTDDDTDDTDNEGRGVIGGLLKQEMSLIDLINTVLLALIFVLIYGML